MGHRVEQVQCIVEFSIWSASHAAIRKQQLQITSSAHLTQIPSCALFDNGRKITSSKLCKTLMDSCSCFSSDDSGTFLMRFGPTGNKATGTHARLLGLFHVLDLIFPILIYRSHTLPSPEQLFKWVALDANRTGTNSDPIGSCIWILCQRGKSCLFWGGNT